MVEAIQQRVDAIGKIGDAFRTLAESMEKNGGVVPEKIKFDIECLEKEYRTIADESSRKLRIAVAGKFSCGKSQFINSLVGVEIASVGSAPTTHCKTIFTGDPYIKTITITDSTGREYTRDEYVCKSAEKSAKRNVFTVKLPDADWQDFEVIDTPGYDSNDEADRQISEEAVAEADIVLFLFDIDQGTIQYDSFRYLKKFAGSEQLFYLVANKADRKPDGARKAILASIAGECDTKGLKYESILLYSSLTTWSREVQAKNESARENVIKLATRLKEDIVSVLRKLRERASVIRTAKERVAITVAGEQLQLVRNNICKYVSMAVRSQMHERFEIMKCMCRDLIEAIVSIMLESAVENAERYAYNLVERHKLRGTGVFWNDWAVYLSGVTWEFDLSGDERQSLTKELHEECVKCGIQNYGVVCRLVELRKNVAIRVVDKYRPKDVEQCANYAEYFQKEAREHDRFCKICRYERECGNLESSIRANILKVFPSTFAELATPVVRTIVECELINNYMGPAIRGGFECMKLTDDFAALCALALNNKTDRASFADVVLEGMSVVASSSEGFVRYSVSPGDSVGKGNDVAKICRGNAAADIVVKSSEAGRIYPLVEDGKIVARFSPLFMIFTECDMLGLVSQRNVDLTGCKGSAEDVVSTVAGVINDLCVEEGARVQRCNRIVTVDIDDRNRFWPIIVDCEGIVSFMVREGDRVTPGTVLAKVYN